MLTVNLAHAKAHLSELIDRIENGEEVVITRRGRPHRPPRSDRKTQATHRLQSARRIP
jgi:antitoxin (DNA-binding transcriptional repressor) of toxin-antitoxin stability system